MSERRPQRSSPLGRPRSPDNPELERDLRDHYAAALTDEWYREVEARVAARVGRAMAMSRQSPPERGPAARWKHSLARHAAAVVCAGAAAVAVGGMLNLGGSTQHPYVPPTSAPSTHQPVKPAGVVQVSLGGGQGFRSTANVL